MIGKLIELGVEDVAEFHLAGALNPSIDTDGELFIGTLYGEQRLLNVKEREMDNSDGAEWTRPYQTKTCVYYLSDELSWVHCRDLN